MNNLFASSSTPSSALNARERMRLAKLAMMADEEFEVEVKRERRKSRRESGFGIALDTHPEVPTAIPSSPASSISSVHSTSPGSTRGKPAGPSILRRSAPPSSFPSSTSSLSSSSLSNLSTEPISATLDSRPSSPGPDMPTFRATRRRSSKVRFSDEHLPPVFTAPPCPPRPEQSSIRRESSIDVLRADLAQNQRMLGVKLNLDPEGLRRRASTASFSSTISDQFALSPTSLTRPSVSGAGSNDFAPQPLPLGRLSRGPSRLNLEVTQASFLSVVKSDTDGTARARDSVSSSSPFTLRDVIDRSSLTLTVLPRDNSSSGSLSILSRSAVRRSYGSISSTLDRASTASGSSGSVSLPKGAAYSTLLPFKVGDVPRHLSTSTGPTMNRDTWYDEELGLSPRSGLSPIEPQDGVCSDASPMETEISPLSGVLEEMIAPPEIERQIDGTPSPLAEPPSPMAVRSRVPDVGDLLGSEGEVSKEIAVNVSEKEKNHARSDSTFSMSGLFGFPLPPTRQTLEVVIGKAAMTASSASPEEVVPMNVFGRSSAQHDELYQCDKNDAETSNKEEQEGVLDIATSDAELVFDTPRPAWPVTDVVPIHDVPASRVMHRGAPVKPVFRRWHTASGPKDSDASDLDFNLSLVSAALKCRIVSPNSRLFQAAVRPAKASRPSARRVISASSVTSSTLRSGRSLTSGKGWSGSESEEEEFVKAIRSIVHRKVSTPRSSRTTTLMTGAIKQMADLDLAHSTPRPSSRLQMERLSQLSQASQTSEVSCGGLSNGSSTEPDSGPLTPCTSHDSMSQVSPVSISMARPPHARYDSSSCIGSTSTLLGDIPWGGSASGSPVGFPTSSSRSSKTSGGRGSKAPTFDDFLEAEKGNSPLPKPKRVVKGWGKPEVLIDEDWTKTRADSSDDESASGFRRKSWVPKGAGKTPKSGPVRASSPDLVVGAGGDWLMDEEMPEMMRENLVNGKRFMGIPL